MPRNSTQLNQSQAQCGLGQVGNSCQSCAVQMCVTCQEKLDKCRCPEASHGYCGNCYKKRRKTKQKKCKTVKHTEKVRVCNNASDVECSQSLPLCDDKSVQENVETTPRKNSCESELANKCPEKCPDKEKTSIDPMLLLLMHCLWKKCQKSERPCCKQCECSGEDGVKRHSESRSERRNSEVFDEKAQRDSRCDCPRMAECDDRPSVVRRESYRSCPCQENIEDENVARLSSRKVLFEPNQCPEYRTTGTQARPSTTSEGMMTSVGEPQTYTPLTTFAPCGQARPSVTSEGMMTSVGEPQSYTPLMKFAPCAQVPSYGFAPSPQQHSREAQSPFMSHAMSPSGMNFEPPPLCVCCGQPPSAPVDQASVFRVCSRASGVRREIPRQCSCPIVHKCKCAIDEPKTVASREPKKVVRDTCDTEVQCGDGLLANPSREQMCEEPTEIECQTDMSFPHHQPVIIMERASDKLGFYPRVSSGGYYRKSDSPRKPRDPSIAIVVDPSNELASSPKKKKSNSNSKKKSLKNGGPE